MAIDTATKRANVIQYGKPFSIAMPIPDSTIDSADRSHVVYTYEQILIIIIPVIPAQAGNRNGMSFNMSNGMSYDMSYDITSRLKQL